MSIDGEVNPPRLDARNPVTTKYCVGRNHPQLASSCKYLNWTTEKKQAGSIHTRDPCMTKAKIVISCAPAHLIQVVSLDFKLPTDQVVEHRKPQDSWEAP